MFQAGEITAASPWPHKGNECITRHARASSTSTHARARAPASVRGEWRARARAITCRRCITFCLLIAVHLRWRGVSYQRHQQQQQQLLLPVWLLPARRPQKKNVWGGGGRCQSLRNESQKEQKQVLQSARRARLKRRVHVDRNRFSSLVSKFSIFWHSGKHAQWLCC